MPEGASPGALRPYSRWRPALDPDHEDAERLRKGDLTGLDGLMGRHGSRLLRYLRRLLGDETMAEDLFQQTWLKVAERIGRYDPGRPFGPWLLVVGRNLGLDHLRRVRPESLDGDVETAALLKGRESSPSALEQLTARERRARLERALVALGPRDREVLSLRFENELSLKEMAALVDAPLPTVKARLYRALRRLRGELLEMGPEEEWGS